ncbi:MAG: Malate dehydrogenase (Oxaloacetate-decarboxylating) [Candidatus Kaiserbacteria bacterium GW2011_GWC2_49_12]|uniref:Malate dehydrogenase (Oxaloacetate-decarboxylating) n=1 Tax=Candidatus Kaiserbacteria bacterium GW2011_GWC2_49_12 TaxID=1618675 RepID=A0A0G1YGL9_9BACT|nr:MAG: Malate dehydrogenase (Oxaloacetate-decarboxylating) [Candidatus Kaiserbacteria bacterium GW2011_GWC2_49_12]
MKKSNVSKEALALHKKLGGKIRIMPASPVRNKADLSLVYTPGVATVSNFVAKNPKRAREYTMKAATSDPWERFPSWKESARFLRRSRE